MTPDLPPLPPFLARELPFQRRRVEVGDGVGMHVMERGEGRPVLLVHGNPTWGFLYRKVARALDDASGLRLVIPDLVGFGFSDKPRSLAAHTLEAHARWMRSLVEALDLRDVILVVQDWGGPIGLLGFEHDSTRLSGIVVMNTVLGPPREGFRPTRFHRFAAMPVVSDLAYRVLGLPQRRLSFVQGDRASISGDTARAYVYPLRRLRDRAAPLALARMVPDSFEHPSIPALRRSQALFDDFAGPVEIVWGRRDPILGRVLGHFRRLKPAARVTATDAGHFLQEEVPTEIADAIRRVAGDG